MLAVALEHDRAQTFARQRIERREQPTIIAPS